VSPKSDAGRRLVPIAPELRALLLAHRIASGRRAGLVLGHDGRRPASPTGLRGRIYRTWDAAGLPRLRIHDGRHTAVTAWLGGGGPVKVAQAIAGHSNVSTTLNVYGHVLPHDLGLATDAMARSIERSRGALALDRGTRGRDPASKAG
jgi:integrase